MKKLVAELDSTQSLFDLLELHGTEENDDGVQVLKPVLEGLTCHDLE